jgi:phage-related protein
MASIQYVVTATDAASAVFAKIGASADGLDKQLEDLSKRVATPEIDLKDAKFTAGMIAAAKRLDKLSAQMAEPGVNLEDGKFQAEIIKINAQLDRLDAKRVEVSVGVDRSALSRLGGLFGGGAAGGAAGGAGGAGGVASRFGNLSGAFAALPAPAIIAAIGAALAALPFIAQAAGAGIVAGLGAGLAGIAILGASKTKAVKDSFADLKKSANADLVKIGAPFVPVLTSIMRTAGTVLNALTPVFKSAAQIMAGPFKLFADTLLKAFGQPAVATSIKDVAKAFGDILKALAPQLPGDIKDIAIGIERIANAISKNPGAFAAMISFLFKATGFALSMVAALTSVANYIEKHFIPALGDIRKAWDDARHQTAVILDGMRHDSAHTWDQIFSNTMGTVIRLTHNVETWFNSGRHETAVIFDGQRHDISHAWDQIWSTTLSQVRNGVNGVLIWFNGMPGRILHALFGLGHQLYAFARAALNEFWSGLKSVAGSVFGWVKNFVSTIWDTVKKFFGINSPSSLFYSAGKNLMLGLENGIKDHAHKAVAAARTVSRQVGNVGSGVQRWAPLVRQALAMEGLSPMLAGNVLYQMQTESGGNPNAINLTDSNAAAGDPSRGLMQTIMSTFQAYHWPGTSGNIYDPLANIAAALNYARHVYGPSLMSGGMGIGSGHGYDTGGWLPTGLSLAWNNTGQPERVLGPGQGGNTYNINVHVPVSANKAETGRQVVEAIKLFERNSGAGWRS